MNRRFPPRGAFGALALTLAVAIAPGCSDDTLDRFAVSGEVTLDGAPLAEGTITLIPADKGAAAAGQIAAGQFRIPASEGPGVGPYLVEIHSVRPTGRKVLDSDDHKTLIEETADLIPYRYNRDTTLRIEVKSGGENHFPLALDSKPDDPSPKGRGARRRR